MLQRKSNSIFMLQLLEAKHKKTNFESFYKKNETTLVL